MKYTFGEIQITGGLSTNLQNLEGWRNIRTLSFMKKPHLKKLFFSKHGRGNTTRQIYR